MVVLIKFLKVCSLPSYFAIFMFLDFCRLKIISILKKDYYDLDAFRFRYRNLTAKDGSKKQLTVFLFILFCTIITSPFFIDIMQIENLYIKPSGTYCYLVQYPSGDTFPAQIKKDEEKYYVEKVYLNDNVFIEYEEDRNEVFIKKPTYVSVINFTDSDYITLLNQHAFHSKIKESTHISVLYGLLFFLLMGSDLFAIIVYHPKIPFDPKNYIDEVLEQYY